MKANRPIMNSLTSGAGGQNQSKSMPLINIFNLILVHSFTDSNRVKVFQHVQASLSVKASS